MPRGQRGPPYPGAPPNMPRVPPGQGGDPSKEVSHPTWKHLQKFPRRPDKPLQRRPSPDSTPAFASPVPPRMKPRAVGHSAGGCFCTKFGNGVIVKLPCFVTGPRIDIYLLSFCFWGHFYCSFCEGPRLGVPLPWEAGSLSCGVKRRSCQAPRRRPHQPSP